MNNAATYLMDRLRAQGYELDQLRRQSAQLRTKVQNLQAELEQMTADRDQRIADHLAVLARLTELQAEQAGQEKTK